MELITQASNSTYLLTVAFCAIATLLFLIMKLKVHAFVSLILVSLGTALATGINIDNIVPTMMSGFGGTLASVALLVGLGAMIGKMIEHAAKTKPRPLRILTIAEKEG